MNAVTAAAPEARTFQSLAKKMNVNLESLKKEVNALAQRLIEEAKAQAKKAAEVKAKDVFSNAVKIGGPAAVIFAVVLVAILFAVQYMTTKVEMEKTAEGDLTVKPKQD